MITYTIDTPLDHFRPEVTAERIRSALQVLKKTSPFLRQEVIDAFIGAGKQFGIDQVYLLSHAILESNWGMSNIAVTKNNLFGYQAYDSDPGQAKTFASYEECIYFIAKFVKNSYLTPGGKWYNGNTLKGMNVRYATATHWGASIAKIANLLEQTFPAGDAQPEVLHGSIGSTTVNADVGVNVRTAPTTRSAVIKSFPNNTSFQYRGWVEGENISGNAIWLKVDGYYVWSGATAFVLPLDTDPVGSPAPQGKTVEELEAALKTLQQQYTTAINNSAIKDTQLLQKDQTIENQYIRITELTEDARNVVSIKSANEGLSTQVTALTGKLMQAKKDLLTAKASAFAGWELVELPISTLAFAAFPGLLFRFIGILVTAHKFGYVVGWKRGAKLYTTEELIKQNTDPSLQQSLPNPNPAIL